MYVLSDVCCQVEVSATGRSLVQGSPTKCDESECDCEDTMRRTWFTGDCWAMEKKILVLFLRLKRTRKTVGLFDL